MREVAIQRLVPLELSFQDGSCHPLKAPWSPCSAAACPFSQLAFTVCLPHPSSSLHTVVLIPVVSWKQGVWAELRPGQPFSTAELGSLSPLAIPSGALQSARKSADSLPLGLSLTRVESQQKL